MTPGNRPLEAGLEHVRDALDALSAAIGDNLRIVATRLEDHNGSGEPLKSIDDLARAARERCLVVVALQQPAARDLRFVMSALRIEHDYERIQELLQALHMRIERLRSSPVQAIVHDLTGILAKLIDLHTLVRQTWKRDQSDSDKATIQPFVDERCTSIRANIADIQAKTMDAISKGQGSAEVLVELVLICRHVKRIEGFFQSIPDEMHSFE